MTEKKFREVQPCGMLYTFGREYFLLSPQPLPKDSWQGDNAYRWVVVLNDPIDSDADGFYYSFARHVVSTAFTVDYKPDMKTIKLWQLEEIDVTYMEWPVEAKENEYIPADVAQAVHEWIWKDVNSND